MSSEPPLLIGLSGQAGSGKTTAADYLWSQHGCYQLAFAAALKDAAAVIWGFTEDHLHGELKEVIDPRWGVSPRWCLQWLGTEVLRSHWPDIWIKHLEEDIKDFRRHNGPRSLVVTDVRFKDEAAALKRLGAVLVRIERRGSGAKAGMFEHVSETALNVNSLDWDFVLDNNGSLAELHTALDRIVGKYTC